MEDDFVVMYAEHKLGRTYATSLNNVRTTVTKIMADFIAVAIWRVSMAIITGSGVTATFESCLQARACLETERRDFTLEKA